MMLTQPVKGGIALSLFTAPPSSWELAGSTELRGSHHAPGGPRGAPRAAPRAAPPAAPPAPAAALLATTAALEPHSRGRG